MPTVIRFQKGRYLSSGIDLSDLFEQLPEPIAYFDSDNRLGACNLSFRNHFPVVVESEFLRRISKSPEPRRSAHAPERPALTGPGVAALPAPRSDLEPQLSRTADGGTILTMRDQSALRRMEESYGRRIDELEDALAAAQQSQQHAINTAHARKDFLTSTSHELRTPLNAILGFSEMMTKEMFGPLPNARYRQYAQIIHDSGAHVLSLVNDLLDLSKLDAGKLELSVEPVEILKIIIDCVRCVEAQSTRDHIGIAVHVDGGAARICGDDRRVHQMLLNLLSNALKFTPFGGEIAVDVFRRGPDVVISVSDTGIGIRQEDIQKVLEPFGQVDSALSHRHQGTGLGLPLTKELAELHGGSLTLESNVDVGTTVTITLPSDASMAQPAAHH
jgi:signal transduction histidine kinase